MVGARGFIRKSPSSWEGNVNSLEQAAEILMRSDAGRGAAGLSRRSEEAGILIGDAIPPSPGAVKRKREARSRLKG
jgi:hypothetical protein